MLFNQCFAAQTKILNYLKDNRITVHTVASGYGLIHHKMREYFNVDLYVQNTNKREDTTNSINGGKQCKGTKNLLHLKWIKA